MLSSQWQQYNGEQTSDENKENYQQGYFKLIQSLILQTYKIRIVKQTVRRITKKILGVKGFTMLQKRMDYFTWINLAVMTTIRNEMN